MRPLLAVLIGGIIAAVLAVIATIIIDHTSVPGWLDVVAWIVALVAWLIWSFPRYFGQTRVT